MAKEIVYFNRENSKRIAEDVRWGESMRNSGKTTFDKNNVQSQQFIFAKLTEKDPAGEKGYWKAKEVRFYDGIWNEIDSGLKWEQTQGTYPYIRHYAWEDAEEGAVVRCFLRYDNDQKKPTWVFDNNVTNPENFVYYSDEGTNGQATKDATWTIKNLGKVCTNVGEIQIGAGVDLTTGQESSVQIVFVDDGGGFKLISATMITGTAAFWVESQGEITVTWRIAKVESHGDMARLIQYYAGDIHLTVYKRATNWDTPTPPDPPYDDVIDIIGDNKWIDVTLNANTYTVSHRVPNPDEPQFDFQAIDKNFDCTDTLAGGASLTDVINKINAILGALQHVFYDTKGHIYKVTDCADALIDETDDSEYDYYEMTLTVVTTDVYPSGSTQGSVDMTLQKNGANFTDWVGVESSLISFRNSLGNFIEFDDGGGMDKLYTDLLINNGGTSGQNYATIDFGTDGYRFNDLVICKCAIAGKNGLIETSTANSKACTVTITADSYSIKPVNYVGSHIINFTLTYSVATVTNDYKTKVTISQNALNETSFEVNGTTFSYDFDGFFIGDPGDVTVTTQMLSINEDYDGNVDGTLSLTYAGFTASITVLGTSSVGTSIDLTAGDYKFYYADRAISPDSGVTWGIGLRITEIPAVLIFNTNGYASEALAIAANVGEVTDVNIPSDGTYHVKFSDTVYGDNSGQVDLIIVKV